MVATAYVSSPILCFCSSIIRVVHPLIPPVECHCNMGGEDRQYKFTILLHIFVIY